MKNVSVASRYAKALFILTDRRRETQLALDDLKAMWEIVRPGTPVGHLLGTPMVLLADKRKVILEKLEGRCLRSVVLFLDLLLRKKRMPELESIVTQFETLVERSQGIRRAQVVSAVPLMPDELARLHGELERHTKGKIKLATEVDPRLLGGALVRIGDRVVDRSVKSLLEAIEQQLWEVTV